MIYCAQLGGDTGKHGTAPGRHNNSDRGSRMAEAESPFLACAVA